MSDRPPPPGVPRPLPAPRSTLRVTVDAMDDEGRGRCQIGGEGPEGYDLAVRGAFPGDDVSCVVERLWPSRRLVQARAVTCHVEGPARLTSTCPHGPPCPGCPLEGAEPSLALALKRGRIERALIDLGLEFTVDDVLTRGGSDRRQKVKLVAGGHPRRLVFGLFAPHSHAVVPAESCPHSHPGLAVALSHLRATLDAHAVDPGPDGLRAVIARAFKEGVGAVLVTGSPLSPRAFSSVTSLVDQGRLTSVGERVSVADGNSLLGGELSRWYGPSRLTPLEGGPLAPVDAFCQSDPVLASQMYQMAAQFLVEGLAEGAGQLEAATVVDAYAGTGGFARAALAMGIGKVVAIERARDSIVPLEETGAEVISLDVASALPQLLPRRPFSGIIADPPRKGLGADAEGLASLGARRFVLVSCDPDALARDLRVLTQSGYRLLRILPVDLFEASPQIEALAFLERTR